MAAWRLPQSSSSRPRTVQWDRPRSSCRSDAGPPCEPWPRNRVRPASRRARIRSSTGASRPSSSTGTALPSPTASRTPRRADVGRGSHAAAVDVIVVSGTHVGNVDGQLAARPTGPVGSTFASIAVRKCSKSTAPASTSSTAARRRPEEEAKLDRSAELTVDRLGCTWTRGTGCLESPEQAEDRPDPGAGMGRAAQGSAPRPAGCCRTASGSCWHRVARGSGGDRPGSCTGCRAP